MSNSVWNKTLTIFNSKMSDGILTWEKHIVNNCFFKYNQQNRKDETGTAEANSFIARIPYRGEELAICPGSLVFLGNVTESIANGESGNCLLEKYKNSGFRVNSFSADTSGFLKHYYLEGE